MEQVRRKWVGMVALGSLPILAAALAAGIGQELGPAGPFPLYHGAEAATVTATGLAAGGYAAATGWLQSGGALRRVLPHLLIAYCYYVLPLQLDWGDAEQTQFVMTMFALGQVMYPFIAFYLGQLQHLRFIRNALDHTRPAHDFWSIFRIGRSGSK